MTEYVKNSTHSVCENVIIYSTLLNRFLQSEKHGLDYLTIAELFSKFKRKLY